MTSQTDLGLVAQDEGAWRRPWAFTRNLLGYRESGIFIALLVIFVALLIISPTFGSRYNLTVVTLQMATIAIMATGQTLVIISGAFDVSQAAVTGFSAMVTGLLAVNAGLNPFLALGIGLGTACPDRCSGWVVARSAPSRPLSRSCFWWWLSCRCF